MLRRERKRRVEAAGAYREAGREDLAEGEEKEAQLIAGYLPAELSDAELQEIVEAAVKRERRAVGQRHGRRDEAGDGERRRPRRRQARLRARQGGAQR